MSKIPFRVIIYILKFFSLEIKNLWISTHVNEIVRFDTETKKGGFKIKYIFGYFKLDKFRKIFKLYNYLNINDDNNDYNATYIISIKNKPFITGYVIKKHVNRYQNADSYIIDKIHRVTKMGTHFSNNGHGYSGLMYIHLETNDKSNIKFYGYKKLTE